MILIQLFLPLPERSLAPEEQYIRKFGGTWFFKLVFTCYHSKDKCESIAVGGFLWSWY